MVIMLDDEGVMPERWIGYASYLQCVKGSKIELMRQFPDPESVLNCTTNDELSLWREAINEASLPNARTALERAWLLSLPATAYPAPLADCADAPACLFGRGHMSCLSSPAIAIVGSRKPSLDGLKLAEHFAFELAKAGFVIVSGLARGIDTAVHRGALMAGGKTIAVMATGIDRIYPAENQNLSSQIISSGALVSEFLPGCAPKRHHFRRRNRTISGLSVATVVIEAGCPSGTLITATAAAEQGRDVYALPWSINHRQGEGCLKLLLEGALLATCPKDVVDGSVWQHPVAETVTVTSAQSDSGLTVTDQVKGGADNASLRSNGVDKREMLAGTDEYQQSLLSLIGDGYHSAEALATALKTDVRDIYRLLTSLEVLGLVARHREGYIKL